MKEHFKKVEEDEDAGLAPTWTSGQVRVRTLQRMSELLRAFSSERPAWRLQELERHLGWDKATTHRFLTALVGIGMLERDEDDSYRIGIFPLELAAIYMSTSHAREQLTALVNRIADLTRLTTQLGVLDNGRVVIVYSAEGSGDLNAAARLGERMPLHATASGKAILSELSDEDVDRHLPETLMAYTAKTITDRSQLLAEIAEARESGIAHSESELAEGLHAVAIAAPAGVLGPLPAGIACAGPSPSMAPEAWEVAERELTSARQEVRRMGISASAAVTASGA